MFAGHFLLAVPREYVVRIGKDGTVRKVIDNLNNPAGLASDRDGNLCVSVVYSKTLKFTLVVVPEGEGEVFIEAGEATLFLPLRPGKPGPRARKYWD
ncbi:MAG: hypothetical protein M1358_16950 [Chloroflexi bacterium]|nr:hypothetical protein [Chloroflexota bacterium]